MKCQSSKGGSQNTFVDHLIQYIQDLNLVKNTRETQFCTSTTDGQTDRRKDGWMDGQTDGHMKRLTDGQTDPLIRRTHLKMCVHL